LATLVVWFLTFVSFKSVSYLPLLLLLFFFYSQYNADAHNTHTTHPYEYTYANSTRMSTSEGLSTVRSEKNVVRAVRTRRPVRAPPIALLSGSGDRTVCSFSLGARLPIVPARLRDQN
jgi:hypothetical protein